MKSTLLSAAISLSILIFATIVFAEVPTRSEITGTFSENFYVKDTVFADYTSGAASGGGEAIFEDHKASGADGGTCTSTSNYMPRDLNFVEKAASFATLSSTNKMQMAAGAYRYRCEGPAFKTAQHNVRLQNLTDATTIKVGTSAYAGAAESVTTASSVEAVFTIAAPKLIQLQHRCNTTRATNGFGVSHTFGTNIYSRCAIWRQ